MIPTMRNAIAPTMITARRAATSGRSRPDAASPIGDQDQLDPDRRLALDPHHDRHPPVRVRPLERLGRIQRRGVHLDDLDVRAGQDLTVGVDRLRGGRHGLRGRRRGLLFGHWAGLQELSITDEARADARATVAAERVGSGAGAVPPPSGPVAPPCRGRPTAWPRVVPRPRWRPASPGMTPAGIGGSDSRP